MDNIKIGSNKSFGIVFFIVFCLIGFYPLTNGGEVRIWSLSLSIIFLFLGLINSQFLTPLNRLWFRFGIFLAKIISPFIMGLVFFGIVTPTGIMMRIFKKDVLRLKKNNLETYWVKRSKEKSSMKNQF
jgi:predicted membrane protein